MQREFESSEHTTHIVKSDGSIDVFKALCAMSSGENSFNKTAGTGLSHGAPREIRPLDLSPGRGCPVVGRLGAGKFLREGEGGFEISPASKWALKGENTSQLWPDRILTTFHTPTDNFLGGVGGE